MFVTKTVCLSTDKAYYENKVVQISTAQDSDLGTKLNRALRNIIVGE